MWVDTNPGLPSVDGWLAHFANDVAACSSAGDETSILAYYDRCGRAANAVLVPFGDAAPLMCLVSTRDVKAGEEILIAYGHDYWMGPADRAVMQLDVIILL